MQDSFPSSKRQPIELQGKYTFMQDDLLQYLTCLLHCKGIRWIIFKSFWGIFLEDHMAFYPFDISINHFCSEWDPLALPSNECFEPLNLCIRKCSLIFIYSSQVHEKSYSHALANLLLLHETQIVKFFAQLNKNTKHYKFREYLIGLRYTQAAGISPHFFQKKNLGNLCSARGLMMRKGTQKKFSVVFACS